MPTSQQLRDEDVRRANALPYFRQGELPPERMKDAEDDDSGFIHVLLLFLRSWPFIRPMFLGRWWYPERGIDTAVADTLTDDEYKFGYAPLLVLVVAVLGVLVTPMELGPVWPMALLYAPIAVMVVGMWPMAVLSGRAQLWATLVVLFAGIATNVVANLFIDGFLDGFYAAMVSFAAFLGWIVQYKNENGRLEFRFRVATHLVYFYAVNFVQRLLGLVVGILLVDIMNQSILQGEPLAPGLSDLLGLPQLSNLNVLELTKEERYDLLWLYLTITLSLFFAQLPLRIIQPYYNMWIMQQINQSLRIALVERWHQLSINYHSDHRTGDSIFRIYQDSAMVTAVIGHLIKVTLTLLSYLSCVVIVTLLSPWIGLLALLLLIPGFAWAHFAMPRVRARSLAYRAATSDVTSNTQETFAAIRLIKAFGTADRAQMKFETDSVTAFNAAYRVRSLIALVTIFMFTFASAFMISGEFLMAYFVTLEKPTWAQDLIALIGVSYIVWNYASFEWTRGQYRESANDLRSLLRDWMTAQDMAMGLRRVFDILDIEPDVKNKEGAVPLTQFKDEIRYDGVNFHYEEDRPVLADVSFTAEPGTITAIIGPTGSGKSTLTSLLLRIFDPMEGSITIDGTDLRDYEVSSLRSQIAIAMQENLLFAMSVRDNIRYVAPFATDDMVREAIRVAAMDEYVEGLPQGLDTVLSDRGGKLSTGQRQRLSIARAIVRNAPILILDEPTAALDAATEHEVMANLADWAQEEKSDVGRAIFLITHRISTIRRADNIIYLDEGRVIESGTHDELMQLPDGRYRAFVEAESNLTNIARGGAA